MSTSIRPTDTRHPLTQDPANGDDYEVAKNSNQVSPPVKPVGTVSHGGATGVKTVTKSK